MKHIAAIILSAGFSSRMKGAFKPLLPLGEGTVLTQVIRIFQISGIADIRVIAGHNAESLKPISGHLRVRIVENPRYEQGMFSSVVAGLETLDETIEGVFVQPADVPVLRPATIQRLLGAFRHRPGRILYPVFLGRRGHPPLIAGRCLPKILAWHGENGLKGALSQLREHALDVPVTDEGILMDMDTGDDYRRIIARFSQLDIPTPEECRAIWEEVGPLPQEVRRHSVAAARIALKLSDELNLKGCRLNEDLVMASALLHDMARDMPHHAKGGSDMLREMGFHRVADIVAVHMDFAPQWTGRVDEAAVVFLADKLVSQDQPVRMTERFKVRMDRHADDPEILAAIRRRERQTVEIRHAVEEIIGMSLEEWTANLIAETGGVP